MASTTCSNCQTEVAPGATSCPSCGASLAATASSGGSSSAGIKFDATSLNKTDRIVGIATVVLFISLFLPWFSASFGGFTATADGLSAHGYLYLTLFVSLAIIGLLGALALGVFTLPASSPVNKDQVLLIGTAVNFVLVLLAFLLKPGGIGSGIGWSFGAFVGLAAAIVAVVPLGMPVIRARQGK
jgi:hypothetical protein